MQRREQKGLTANTFRVLSNILWRNPIFQHMLLCLEASAKASLVQAEKTSGDRKYSTHVLSCE